MNRFIIFSDLVPILDLILNDADVSGFGIGFGPVEMAFPDQAQMLILKGQIIL